MCVCVCTSTCILVCVCAFLSVNANTQCRSAHVEVTEQNNQALVFLHLFEAGSLLIFICLHQTGQPERTQGFLVSTIIPLQEF